MSNIVHFASASATNADLDMVVLRTDARQGEVVLRKVYDFLGRFVAYPSEDAHVAHTLWCVHTHFMDVWETTPRIAFLSAEPASGKSRALEISELVVPNPVLTINVSPSYIFRKVGSKEGGATILYDEIDTVFGPRAKDNEEIRGLLNAGYRKGATAGRCVVKGNIIETEDLPAYAAVALAGLGWLPDTILSRSIVVRMRKRLPTEKVEPYRRKLHAAEGGRVRASIELWARSIKDEVTEPPLPPDIVDRDADVWEPLITIATTAGGDWPERSLRAARQLIAAGRDLEPTLGVQLLRDCRTAFGESNEMPTKLLLAALTAMAESPWGTVNKGLPLDDRSLSNRLRQYGIGPTQIRIGEYTPRGYRRQDFMDAWARYAPTSADKCKTDKTAKQDDDVLPVVAVLPPGEPDPEGWQFQHDDAPGGRQ
jgi:hypothetical protein